MVLIFFVAWSCIAWIIVAFLAFKLRAIRNAKETASLMSSNIDILPCQAEDCINKATVHLCSECWNKVNHVLHLPPEAV